MYDAIRHLENMVQVGVEEGLDLFYEDVYDKNVLEIGFGNGKLLEKLYAKNNMCYGVDASKLAVLTLMSKNPKIPTFLQDVCMNNLNFQDGHFDVVYLYNTIEYLMNPLGALLEIKRILKSDGIFVICWDYKKKIVGYPELTTYKNMRKFLNNAYFKVIDEAVDDRYIYQKCKNKKLNRIEILDIVNNNIETRDWFNDVETPFMLDVSNEDDE